ATVFGFLFGSVFGREDVIPALWLHPMAAPVTLLVVPLMGGALLLALGLALNALEMIWRGELWRWLASEAGMLLCYVAAIGAVLQPELGWIVLAGIIWFVAGHALLERRWTAVFGGLGHAFERAFQLAVNTLSFARVGAFALAHAGLGIAMTTLADAVGAGTAVAVMIAGNVLVIALEGLVVSIQTTRLVLFEFFVRFLRSGGRPFRPLAAPG
ncbi:MAG TPA: hypothetical protein PL143_06875, partial [Rhodocyclaceae bacterium]|nr:hypothetical protein [Rhodocyclaceae bacterium]